VERVVRDAFARAAAGAGYAIERTTIEGHGRCPACRVAA
jgi:Fur family zinc uptake transcriptional regulator